MRERIASGLLHLLLFTLTAVVGVGCVSIPPAPDYHGPKVRPLELEQYYSVGDSYRDYLDEILLRTDSYTVKRIEIETDFGRIRVDFFQRKRPSDHLIFVFPVKGGSNLFSNYFARYFAEHGLDTAVVHRDGSFKNPENFHALEEIFRRNVIRDRITMDFFEAEYGKRQFGSFGISRGAINAAMTAGVDARLRYNVLAMGGADLAHLFVESGDPGMVKYRRRVMHQNNISTEQFYAFLEETIRTDPKVVASHINARDTLLFLALFDNSVPIKYGLKLRRRLGYPRTEFILSGHYASVAYTQFARLVLPSDDFCVFPLDYVESESLAFYREAFGQSKTSFGHVLINVIRAPVTLIAEILASFL